MLKKIKKAVYLLLALILSVAVISPVAVNAESISMEESAISDQVLFSFTGKQTAAKLSNRLENYGVPVEDDTLLQVVKPNSGSDSTALMVTNQEGYQVSQNLFMVLDEEGNDVPIPVPTVPGDAQLMGTNDGFGFDWDDLFSGGSFICRWAVLYDYQLVGGMQYFRPKHAQFVCLYSASDGYSVTDACMQVVAEGTEFDSNFNVLSLETFEHKIIISQSVVARNTYYAKTDEYDANRWICTNAGDFYVKMDLWVNGRRYFEYWHLPNLILNG